MAKDWTNEQRVAAATTIIELVNALDEAHGDEAREFIRYAATSTFVGDVDPGLRVALDTIGVEYVKHVDRIVACAESSARGVAAAERYARIKAAGRTPCSRCRATGTFINGGECWSCDGRGYRAA